MVTKGEVNGRVLEPAPKKGLRLTPHSRFDCAGGAIGYNGGEAATFLASPVGEVPRSGERVAFPAGEGVAGGDECVSNCSTTPALRATPPLEGQERMR